VQPDPGGRMTGCKGLLIILDGLGDRPVPGLGCSTPLEAAHTPYLDKLAAAGCCGLVDPLHPGMPVGAHTGTGVLFGISPPDILHLARGPVDALGTGLPVMPGDIALRCNFATLTADSKGLAVVDRRAGCIGKDTMALAEALQDIPLDDGFTASFRPATGHRAVLRLSGPAPLPGLSDTDPGTCNGAEHVLTSQSLDAENPVGELAARALNSFVHQAHERLRDHPVNRQRVTDGRPPANGIITRDAGSIGNIRNIIHHLGLRAAAIAGDRSVIGLGHICGFTVTTRPEFTAMPDTNLTAKINAALAALNDHDLVFLHIKAPDIFAHDRDPLGKSAMLETIDNALAILYREEMLIGVTANYSSDSNTGCHCGDPVPAVLYSPAGRRDTCREFGEAGCLNGGLGRITGQGFLLTLLDAMGAMPAYRTIDSAFLAGC
jgi:2,3-bisphosphoglycerate-independent phosphoglycerate mutase